MSKHKDGKDFADDGRVIADMQVEGLPPRRGLRLWRRSGRDDRVSVTGRERLKLILAAYMAYFPYLLCMILGFSIVFFLLKVLYGA